MTIEAIKNGWALILLTNGVGVSGEELEIRPPISDHRKGRVLFRFSTSAHSVECPSQWKKELVVPSECVCVPTMVE